MHAIRVHVDAPLETTKNGWRLLTLSYGVEKISKSILSSLRNNRNSAHTINKHPEWQRRRVCVRMFTDTGWMAKNFDGKMEWIYCVSDWHTSNSRCFRNTISASLFYRRSVLVCCATTWRCTLIYSHWTFRSKAIAQKKVWRKCACVCGADPE